MAVCKEGVGCKALAICAFAVDSWEHTSRGGHCLICPCQLTFVDECFIVIRVVSELYLHPS